MAGPLWGQSLGLISRRAALGPSDFASESPVHDLLVPALHLRRAGGREVGRGLWRGSPGPTPLRPARPCVAPLSAHPAYGAQRVEHAEIILAGLCTLPAEVHALDAAMVVCGRGRASGRGASTPAPLRTWPRPLGKAPPLLPRPQKCPGLSPASSRKTPPILRPSRTSSRLQDRPRPLHDLVLPLPGSSPLLPRLALPDSGHPPAPFIQGSAPTWEALPFPPRPAPPPTPTVSDPAASPGPSPHPQEGRAILLPIVSHLLPLTWPTGSYPGSSGSSYGSDSGWGSAGRMVALAISLWRTSGNQYPTSTKAASPAGRARVPGNLGGNPRS